MLFADNMQGHAHRMYMDAALHQPLPLISAPHYPIPLHTCQTLFLLTWRTSFSCSWCEYLSTLVPGLLSTVLPLLLHQPQGTPQIKLHIYIDDINNISLLVWYLTSGSISMTEVRTNSPHLQSWKPTLCGETCLQIYGPRYQYSARTLDQVKGITITSQCKIWRPDCSPGFESGISPAPMSNYHFQMGCPLGWCFVLGLSLSWYSALSPTKHWIFFCIFKQWSLSSG